MVKMQGVRSNDIGPEIIVLRLAQRMGLSISLAPEGLPGKPDPLFPRLGNAIFVNGCSWRCHDCARPKSAEANERRLRI